MRTVTPSIRMSHPHWPHNRRHMSPRNLHETHPLFVLRYYHASPQLTWEFRNSALYRDPDESRWIHTTLFACEASTKRRHFVCRTSRKRARFAGTQHTEWASWCEFTIKSYSYRC